MITVELTVMISVLCSLGSVGLAYFAFRRLSRNDATEEGKSDGVVLTELGYVKAGVDDIKREQREQARTNIEVLTRLTAVEASAKQAHKRLDGLEVPHT